MSDSKTVTGAPNLDAMPRSELAQWAAAVEADTAGMALELFPGELPGRREQAMRTLLAYAHTKAAAMALREVGGISDALAVEAQCERLYALLPKFARW